MTSSCSICRKCGLEKDITSFGIRKLEVSGRNKICLVCVRESNTKIVFDIRAKKLEELGKYSCGVCGYNNPFAKEVHHLSTSYKRYGRSQDIRYNLEDIKNKQAIVLCSNCHSIFHGIHGGKNKVFPLYSEEETIQLIKDSRRLS